MKVSVYPIEALFCGIQYSDSLQWLYLKCNEKAMTDYDNLTDSASENGCPLQSIILIIIVEANAIDTNDSDLFSMTSFSSNLQ